MPNWIGASLSKPTCSYKKLSYGQLFGTQQGLLGRPLRPQNLRNTNGELMPNGKRNIVKRLRFLAEQAQQLDQLLIRENMIFTDFIHLLIAREFMSKQHTVLKYVEITDELEKVEIKRRHRRREKFIRPSAPKVDPELLRELGRIGNNINQIARSLNRLCLEKQADRERFSYGMCLKILGEIQQELYQYLQPLPPIFRSDKAVERINQRARARVTTGRD